MAFLEILPCDIVMDFSVEVSAVIDVWKMVVIDIIETGISFRENYINKDDIFCSVIGDDRH